MNDVVGAIFSTGLTLIVGGLSVLAFIVAPMLFRSLPSREAAGSTFGRIFTAFGGVELTAAIAVCSCAVYWAYEAPGPRATLRLWMAGALLLVSILHHLWVFPVGRRMAEQPEARDRFKRVHRLSVSLAMATLLLGLALVVQAAV